MAMRKNQPRIKQQYGARWSTGAVFAYASREAAERAIEENGHGSGVLVVMSYDSVTHTAVSEWQRVED